MALYNFIILIPFILKNADTQPNHRLFFILFWISIVVTSTLTCLWIEMRMYFFRVAEAILLLFKCRRWLNSKLLWSILWSDSKIMQPKSRRKHIQVTDVIQITWADPQSKRSSSWNSSTVKTIEKRIYYDADCSFTFDVTKFIAWKSSSRIAHAICVKIHQFIPLDRVHSLNSLNLQLIRLR